MKKISFYIIYFILLILLFEGVFRIYYAISFKQIAILWRPLEVLNHYYPGITAAIDEKIEPQNGRLDILLLGGSTLTSQWGSIPEELAKLLSDSLKVPFKIHNLASPANTSRDSRQKYDLLANNAYDVVLVYHGLNEVRFNHCAPEVFKSDYSHVDFYAKVNHLIEHPLKKITVLPLVYYQLKVNVWRKWANHAFMPFHAPTHPENSAWLAYGTNVKTAPVFYDNYKAMARSATTKGQIFITPRYLIYIPDNYTLEGFKNKQLDYDKHLNPIELWGSLSSVKAGVSAHNEQLVKLSKLYAHDAHYRYVDFAQNFQNGKQNYNDLCHFNANGSHTFVALLWPTLKEAMQQKENF